MTKIVLPQNSVNQHLYLVFKRECLAYEIWDGIFGIGWCLWYWDVLFSVFNQLTFHFLGNCCTVLWINFNQSTPFCVPCGKLCSMWKIVCQRLKKYDKIMSLLAFISNLTHATLDLGLAFLPSLCHTVHSPFLARYFVSTGDFVGLPCIKYCRPNAMWVR